MTFIKKGVLYVIHVKEILSDENTVTLNVSGVLDGETVQILRKVCDQHLDKGRKVTVNLEATAHITRDGRGFIQEISSNVGIVHAPEFMKTDSRS
jgi:hypothetical protein